MEALTDAAIGAPAGARSPRTGVVDAVAAHYGVSLRDLRGRSRTKEIVLPRQVAMYLLREETERLAAGDRPGAGRPRPHDGACTASPRSSAPSTTDTALRSQVMAIREAIFTAAGA